MTDLNLTLCDIEPFLYQAAPQLDAESGASSNQINEQQIESYLNRLRQAMCTDLQAIVDQCCGSGGAESFLDLSDTPASYAGDAGKSVIVNPAEDGLLFGTPAPVADEDGITLDYSLSEQTTNRVWLAGEPIYQKTIDFGALPNTTTKDVAHNITGLYDVLHHRAWTTDGSTRRPLPFVAATLAGMITLAVTNTVVRVVTGANQTAFSRTYVTLFYLKS